MTHLRKLHPAVFYLALVSIGLTYWVYCWAKSPGITVDQATLFRPDGDGDYLPQVSALARIEFGETSVRDSAHPGVRSFPMPVVFLHAASKRILGDWGFPAAEILVFLLYGAGLAYLMRSAGVTRGVAELLSLLVVAGAANQMIAATSRVIGSFPLAFWHSRFPRPSVTEIFVVAFLILAIRLMTAPEKTPLREWLAAGIVLGCVIQADIYQATNVLAASVVLGGYVLLRAGRRGLRGLLSAACAAAIASIPFLYQRMHESADVPRRWGLFSSHRLEMFMPSRLFLLAIAVVLVEAVFYLRSRGDAGRRVRAGALVSALVMLISLVTGPLSLVVLGKGIQIYHYIVAAELCTGYALLLCAGWTLDALSRKLAGRSWARDLAIAGAIAGTAAVCLLAVISVSQRSLGEVWWGRTQPAVPSPSIRNRVDRKVESDYRASFAALRARLGQHDLEGADILATFDGQLANWWEYEGRHLFLPDLFNTTVSDAEIQERVYRFLHMTGVTAEEFDSMADNWYFQFRVLSGAKYQANSMFTPWPLADYSQDARKRIMRRSALEATTLEIPEPERKRLVEAYAHFVPDRQPYRKPDLVVLSTGELRRYLHPEKGKLRLTWKNETFEIWAPEDQPEIRPQAATEAQLK